MKHQYCHCGSSRFQPGGGPSRGLLRDSKTLRSLREPFFEALVAWHRNWDKGAHKMYATQTQTFFLFSVNCNSKIIFDTKSSNSRKSRHCHSNRTESKAQICWLFPKFKTCGLVELSTKQYLLLHIHKKMFETPFASPSVRAVRWSRALPRLTRGRGEK